MSNRKHAPAPFKIRRFDRNTILIKNEFKTVCRITHPFGDDEAEADALLLHAAPDMLEALRDLVNAHEAKMGASAINLRIEIASEVITKATKK